jgi:ribosomal protein L30E
MELKNLQKHIHTLATLEETDSPVISCYLNWEVGASGHRPVLKERGRILRQGLSGQARQDFEEALDRIEAFITTELLPDAKGVAIFARGGAQPFFLPLQFRVPLPTWMAVNSTPNIYHLVELKDTYHRYVVMISTRESVRIVEVSLGAVTEELWRQRPELRKRVGREWTKEHYQSHRRERTSHFIKEQIKILEQLVEAGGHKHLVLAGNPHMTAQIWRALPKHLADRLIDTAVASSHNRISDVVRATLASFIEQEEQESLAIADELERESRTGGLAVVGSETSLEALKRGQADVLVLARDMPDPEIREELVRLAAQNQCQVEVVSFGDFLMEFGGVGCLLRYLTPDQY